MLQVIRVRVASPVWCDLVSLDFFLIHENCGKNVWGFKNATTTLNTYFRLGGNQQTDVVKNQQQQQKQDVKRTKYLLQKIMKVKKHVHLLCNGSQEDERCLLPQGIWETCVQSQAFSKLIKEIEQINPLHLQKNQV